MSHSCGFEKVGFIFKFHIRHLISSSRELSLLPLFSRCICLIKWTSSFLGPRPCRKSTWPAEVMTVHVGGNGASDLRLSVSLYGHEWNFPTEFDYLTVLLDKKSSEAPIIDYGRACRWKERKAPRPKITLTQKMARDDFLLASLFRFEQYRPH